MSLESTQSYYEKAYGLHGFNAQRRYPNEELMRFLGRTYASSSHDQRRAIAALEVGSGAGANLWALASEGFDTHGLDISAAALDLCRKMLTRYGVSAKLELGSMTALPFPDQSLDLVVDVFSANCLDEKEFATFIEEVTRVLKPGGRYFSYHPSKNSDAFRNHAPSVKVDDSTLAGIWRTTSPFYTTPCNFRFISSDEYRQVLTKKGFAVPYLETTGRTYRSMQEYFEFVTIVGERSSAG